MNLNMYFPIEKPSFKTSSCNLPEAKGLVSPCFLRTNHGQQPHQFFFWGCWTQSQKKPWVKKKKQKNRKESTSLQETCIEPKLRSVSIHKHGREVLQPPITKKWVFFFWISTTAVDGRNPPNLVRIKNLLGFITNLNWCEPDFFHQRSDSCGEI